MVTSSIFAFTSKQDLSLIPSPTRSTEKERSRRRSRRRETRIRSTGPDVKVKVNKDIAKRLVTNGEEDKLADDRFKNMFEDEDFTVDVTSHEFRMINPVSSTIKPGGNRDGGMGPDRERLRGKTAAELLR